MKEEKVLVVLFGWMGAQTKHVQKYADWWAGFNCDTIITCGTPLSTFNPVETNKKAQAIVKQLQAYVTNNPNSQIIFHAFSNGGGFIVSRVLHILEGKNYTQVRERVKFHVLDSLLDVFVMSAFRAFLALKLPIYVNIVFYMLFPFIVLFAVATSFYHTNLTGYTIRNTPTHVLYSASDAICKPHEIEYFINYLRSHNVATSSHKFHDSPHVGHFRLHPEEYTKSVLEFLASNGMQLEARRSISSK